MSSTSSKGKKKTTFNPDIPPFQHLVGVSPTAGSTVSATSSNKRPRSETVSSLAGLHKGESNPAAYWHNRFKRENRENGDLPTSGTLQLIVGYLGDIQRDYITLLDKHSEEIWKLQNELSEYRHGRIADKTTLTQAHANIYITEQHSQSLDKQAADIAKVSSWASKNFKALEIQLASLQPSAETSGSTPDAAAAIPPPPPPPPPPPAPTPAPSTWAQVAKRGRKKNSQPSAKPAPAAATPQTTPKAPSPKKGLTLRERRLLIKRDGSALTTSIIAIRDNINAALQATLIQRVECNSANDMPITTMDTVNATSLNSKISQFLHLIHGTTTIQLDSPSAQLLVHGIPTSYSLADIGNELTTYNTGLALAQQPRWLRPEEQRVGKKA